MDAVNAQPIPVAVLPVNIPDAVKALLPSVSLLKEAKERATGAKVREAIVTELEKLEFKKRVGAVTTLMEKIKENKAAFGKIKPNYAGFDVDPSTGAKKPVGPPIYDATQAASLKKIIEDGNKLEEAVRLAVDNDDFTKAYALSGNGSNKQETTTEQE